VLFDALGYLGCRRPSSAIAGRGNASSKAYYGPIDIRQLGRSVMDRRTFVSAAAGALLVRALPANAQPAKKVPRIGVLYAGPTTASQFAAAFTQGLRDHGYAEGQNIVFERRFGDAKPERTAELAAELVRLKVDVIVTNTDVAIAAVKQQTQTIPIVMANSTDPVGTGFVASLARPGGNITGLTGISPELSAKRLELLKEVVPGLSRVAIMWNPDVRGAVLDHKETQSAARSLGLQLQSVEVSRADDFERAFSRLTTGRAEALIVVASSLAFANRDQLASLADKHRLPAMYGRREYVDAGGLIAYGSNLAEHWRRAATYVDKILKGAKPGDLPVEQPTEFELVINLKTAKALGLTIPPSLLRRADEVIQ
jgi:putative tryptophan/tyrosine transport system substrate-binding protein